MPSKILEKIIKRGFFISRIIENYMNRAGGAASVVLNLGFATKGGWSRSAITLTSFVFLLFSACNVDSDMIQLCVMKTEINIIETAIFPVFSRLCLFSTPAFFNTFDHRSQASKYCESQCGRELSDSSVSLKNSVRVPTPGTEKSLPKTLPTEYGWGLSWLPI